MTTDREVAASGSNWIVNWVFGGMILLWIGGLVVFGIYESRYPNERQNWQKQEALEQERKLVRAFALRCTPEVPGTPEGLVAFPCGSDAIFQESIELFLKRNTHLELVFAMAGRTGYLASFRKK